MSYGKRKLSDADFHEGRRSQQPIFAPGANDGAPGPSQAAPINPGAANIYDQIQSFNSYRQQASASDNSGPIRRSEFIRDFESHTPTEQEDDGAEEGEPQSQAGHPTMVHQPRRPKENHVPALEQQAVRFDYKNLEPVEKYPSPVYRDPYGELFTCQITNRAIKYTLESDDEILSTVLIQGEQLREVRQDRPCPMPIHRYPVQIWKRVGCFGFVQSKLMYLLGSELIIGRTCSTGFTRWVFVGTTEELPQEAKRLPAVFGPLTHTPSVPDSKLEESAAALVEYLNEDSSVDDPVWLKLPYYDGFGNLESYLLYTSLT
ncbi:hypothetical protein PFICI_02952 [Pestalotiopsis fici W106-1]|uniref:Uncharacterized protein n=1 Tax=Pestalotiopsis fici (strain W106-1 / CGMCC3.15140) TaxID=1229662 RepID=W3XHL5_PESFW|nr:uncharacterized protein PFICI_02952 [Pestalotiopsis fici W106-1]ETS84927.1 hypothetical protein PFICI_02952 [Pestalotiopsis fici W106-1]